MADPLRAILRQTASTLRDLADHIDAYLIAPAPVDRIAFAAFMQELVNILIHAEFERGKHNL